jgi:hypothetical protein
MATTHSCAECAKHPTMHPQVAVCGVPIDEPLAPLIDMLWTLGIDTSESCQDGNDDHGLGRRDQTCTAYICFTT